MKFLIDTTLIVALLCGGGVATHKIYTIVRKITLTKISKGLTPLGPYTEQLVGKQSKLKNFISHE